MKIKPDHLLEINPGEDWQLEIKLSPNTKAGLNPQKIVIATTNYLRFEDAVRAFQTPHAKSYHLLLGRNGRDLVQMVPFDQQARCTAGFEPDVIAIALDYTPKTSAAQDADPTKTITTVAGNHVHVTVPTFPPEQLDGLLDLLVTLQAETGIQEILPLQDIYPPGSMPGPAFPLVQLRERLYKRTQGHTRGRMALDEIVSPAPLHNTPDPTTPLILPQSLPSGTPVFICEEWKDWVRVEVLAEMQDSHWWMGWVKSDRVQALLYDMEVRDNRLETMGGRQFRFFPAIKNNYDYKKVLPKEDIQFIVMHITTGPHLQATINTFQNKDEGVSAHFVVARDGRVIQMVPLDHAAYHAGSGLWEGKGLFNRCSIGIEVDNAGKLSEGGGRVYARRGDLTIPEGHYERIRHWRDYHVKPWESFPEIQKKAAFNIVKALERYFKPIQEILEHERISLLTRTDPGPLFPMEELRQEVLGRIEPVFERYRLIRESTLYQNSYYKVPKDEYLKYPSPKSECQIAIVFDESSYWTKIEIVKYQTKKWHGRKGWVRKNDIFTKDGKVYLTPKRDFYQDPDDKLEPPCLPLVQLPAGTEARIQKTGKNRWCLVAVPDHKPGYKFLEGWLRIDDLEKV